MYPPHYGPWSYRSRQDVLGHRLKKGVVRRALRYAAWYRALVALFLTATVAGSLLAAVPPLLFRRLIDQALPQKDPASIAWLAVAAVGVALAGAGIGLAARWFSSRVGEGLIFDLRGRLFDHVQRMPLAFFTRVQTGALLSRLNSDVIGAQQAVTGTLGNIVANTIGVTAILFVMLALEWRLTLLALGVLPLFLIPAKRFGRRLAGATREQMSLNAEMNTLMTERFNVAGALVAKLFGRP
ncbi:MAG: ABC transporter transmembrane domain-containing protein, partial [Actinomycetota bacterium]